MFVNIIFWLLNWPNKVMEVKFQPLVRLDTGAISTPKKCWHYEQLLF